MRRIWIFFCICGLLLSLVGCGGETRFQYTYIDVFDTVTTLMLYADTREDADALAADIHAYLVSLHREYTAYEAFDGVNNVKTINDRAGTSVTVSDTLFRMLQFGKQAYRLSNGRVNMAMGSVLALWHDARENAVLPNETALSDAAAHCSVDKVVLDAEQKTVCLTDPAMRLDVGAFAKGYAVQQTADFMRERGITAAMLSVGGNVVTVGDKQGAPFTIGIEDPKGEQPYLLTVNSANSAVVSSGDYQRYFMAEGVRYHHLIDPDTLYPATHHSLVSVTGPDSGTADVLSTALFLLPQTAGQQILDTVEGYEAVWVDTQGNILYSKNFDDYTDAEDVA